MTSNANLLSSVDPYRKLVALPIPIPNKVKPTTNQFALNNADNNVTHYEQPLLQGGYFSDSGGNCEILLTLPTTELFTFSLWND